MAMLAKSGVSSTAADECVKGSNSGAGLGPLTVKLTLLSLAGVLGYAGLRIGVAVGRSFNGVACGALTGFAGREGCNSFLGSAFAIVGVLIGFAEDALVSDSVSTGWVTGVCAMATSSIRGSFVGGISCVGDIATGTTDSWFSDVGGAISTTCLRGLLGIEAGAMSGKGRKPPTIIGEIISSDLFAPNVAVLTPQSFKSGKLSSSSPAQSMWLPGVDGLLSIATALTRSTRASISLRMSKR